MNSHSTNHRSNRAAVGSRRRPLRGGYTLVELLLSMAAATMLMAGLASSLLIAGCAFRLDSSPMAQRGMAAEVQADLMADLNHALSFSERTASAVTFTVPDRNSDGNPETIRYAWSGTAGDPLTYTFNGSAVTLIDGVNQFDLSYLTREMKADFIGPEKVLFVVTNTLLPSLEELLRNVQLITWGYTVEMIGANESQGAFDSAIANNHVAYVSEEVGSGDVDTKLRNATIGVVNGEPYLCNEMGFASDYSLPSRTSINVVDNTHYITSEFNTGPLTVVGFSQQLGMLHGTLAGDLQTLAEIDDSGTNRPALAVLEVGDSLQGGGSASGRRVQLPWGGDSFSFATLNNNGKTLLKRSIDWAGEQTPGVVPTLPFPVMEEFTEAKRGSNGYSLSIPKPPGTAAGDLLIAVVATDGDTRDDLSAPAGWTTGLVLNNGTSVTLGGWWKIAGAGEPASYDFTWYGSNGEQAYGWIMRITGHDPANPVNGGYFGQGTGTTSPVCPSVTSTVENTLVIRLGAFAEDNIDVDSPGLPGHTPITMDRSDWGSGAVSGGAGYTTQAAAGSTGTSNFSLDNGDPYVTVTFVIAPVP